MRERSINLKRIISMAVALLIVIASFAVPEASFAATTAPNPIAEAAYLIDMTTGKVLFEKNPDKRLYPASTTKMMTCILALENLDTKGYMTVDAEAAGIGGNTMNLKAGETINIGNLLSAMMVISGNDAAVAVAKEVSGTVGEFANLMNAKAEELGCTNTHFVNPNGLHDDDHYSSARDLATIAQYCMENEVFRRIVGRAEVDVPITNLTLSERHYQNTNLLLFDTTKNNSVYVDGVLRVCKYDGCIGIKTGYTAKAGGCLVSAAERDGTTLLCVVLNSGSTERFSDSIALLDWGFANYKTATILEDGWVAGTVKVKRGVESKVEAVLNENAVVTIPAEANESVITIETKLDEKLTAPVKEGDVIGKLTLLRVDKPMVEYDLVAAKTVEQGTGSWVKTLGWIALAVLGIIIIAIIIFIIQERKAAARRKAAREARRAEREAEEAKKREEWEKRYRNRYR
ncbi:MAG: D-alanyl-D-alanine carboxypeptidase [Firmicutes bacterium]|nr:D-alanyl-D-alanine carboxypeptidase [Bacillota bacterium]